MTDTILRLAAAALIAVSCNNLADSGFYTVSDGQFVKDETPCYYIGTNFWYGPLLAADGPSSDIGRLCAELDSLKALGMTNLRVLAGGDGPAGVPTRIEPTLQTGAGEYDEAVFKGLDRFLAELGKRNMTAVLYLNNAWEWSGGYGQYLEWAGYGKAVIPAVDGWPAYMESAGKFITDDRAKDLFADHVRTVVSRINSVTGTAYRDDPAIFAWQICNEPRCFSTSEENKEEFAEWINETAALIKSIDPNHMVSTGSEGSWGCENDIALFEKIHSSPYIDYLTIHIWPYNWGWVKSPAVEAGLDTAILNTDKYIDTHIAIAEKLGKPLVIEEFGFPRDGFSFRKGSPVTGRDRYYSHIFNRIIESKETSGALAGANFWGWGGLAGQSATDTFWKPGDDYCGDPAQEQQGLNSVYMADSSTVGIIRSAVAYLETTYGVSAEVLLENDWMYTSDAPARLRVAVKSDIPLKKTGAVVSMALATDKGEEIERQSRILSRGGETDTLTFSFNLAPGFYRVRACIELPDNTGADRVIREFNIGCDPEEIISEPDRQPDFDEFWKESLAQLSETAPEYRLTLLPERSNSIRRTYMVDMVSFGGEHISGIYIEPVAEGKYPAFINYMGYGSDVWYNDPSARPEAIEFTLCLRNQALNRAPGEKDDWVVRGLSDKDTYYYRGAFMDVIRAVDFVASREKTDPDRIFAEGGSQGGAQTIVAAALDGRIRAIAPFVPFLSDFRDYFRIASWPAGPVLAEAARLGISDDDLYTTLSYFDIKNFAGRITCPVIMGFGLQDDVCPPHTNFAAYNQIPAPKQYVTFPLSGHHVEQEAGWWQARDTFFEKYL